MTRVLIALGSNLGDRAATLREALEHLGTAGVAIDRCSSVWETDPVPADQPRYLNAVVGGETELEPEVLLDRLKSIEADLGRRPGRRWGPRPIDLDILFYGELHLESDRLVIPHPRIRERAFVLAPLAEVVGGPLPVLGKTAEDLIERVGREGVERTEERLDPPPLPR